jgi:hypothetical protein
MENRGRPPVLTEVQRAEIAAVMVEKEQRRKRIREIDDAIAALRREQNTERRAFEKLPTSKQLRAKYGVVDATLHWARHHAYQRVNVLDERAAHQ